MERERLQSGSASANFPYEGGRKRLVDLWSMSLIVPKSRCLTTSTAWRSDIFHPHPVAKRYRAFSGKTRCQNLQVVSTIKKNVGHFIIESCIYSILPVHVTYPTGW